MKHRTIFHNIYRAFLMALFAISFSIVIGSHAIADTETEKYCKQLAMTNSWSDVLEKAGAACDISAYPLNTGGWIQYQVPTSAGYQELLGCVHGKCRWAQAQYFLNGQWTALELWSGYFLYNSIMWWVPPELLGTTTPWRWRTLEKRGEDWVYIYTTNTFYMPKRALTTVVCFVDNCPAQ